MNDAPTDSAARSCVRRWLIAAMLVACCLGLNVYHARTLGMDRVVPFWVAQAVPAGAVETCGSILPAITPA